MSRLAQNTLQRRAVSGPTLTSRQQFTVLDALIVRALQPLHSETEAFMEWVGEMLCRSVRSRRSNAAEMTSACARVLSGDPRAVELLMNAGLDRGHAFAFLNKMETLHSDMTRAEMAIIRGDQPRADHLAALQRCKILLGDGARVSAALRTSSYWHHRAADWRNRIVDHYLKLILKGSVSMNRLSGGRVEVDSTFHDAWVTVANAANRFRSDYGVFSSFLGRGLRGTYRVAASNALGLAAPGARVQSDKALQTAPLEQAAEMPLHPVVNTGSDEDRLQRALMVLCVSADVRVALAVSSADPTLTMASIGLGPHAWRG